MGCRGRLSCLSYLSSRAGRCLVFCHFRRRRETVLRLRSQTFSAIPIRKGCGLLRGNVGRAVVLLYC